MPTKTIKVPKIVNGAPTAEIINVTVDDLGNTGWGPKTKHRLLNTKLPRVDSPAKTTGTAIYTHDVRAPGMLHGRLVTSPHAHATIASMSIDAALKIPGVKAVMPVVNVGAELYYEGQPVAAVAATTPEIALDAARAILVKYTVLPHLVTVDDAIKPGAPQTVRGGGAPGRGGGGGQGNLDDANAAVAACQAVVDVEYRTPILHHCCLETHSVVADYRGGNTATVYVSTQGTTSIPGEAARELGGATVTGIVANMGGGFGSKGGGIGIAGQWACRLAKQLNTPVKMVMTRREEFLNTGNGPGSVQKLKAGVNKDGLIRAMTATQYSQGGLGRSGVNPQPYMYRARANGDPNPLVLFQQSISVNTNEDSSVPLRAPGSPQASFAMESLMDELAYKINMDPIDFRKVNVPNNADGTAWKRQLDTGAKAIGWASRNPIAGAGTSTLKRGMGCAIGAWGGGGRGGCIVDITIKQDGSVLVTSASQDLGTGTRTYVRAIVAEELGLDMADVVEKIGNSTYGAAGGSGGSTTAASLSPAVKDAAYQARIALSKLVAPLLGEENPDLILLDQRYVMGNSKAITWKQACAAVPADGLHARGQWQGALSGNRAHGASFAEVEVDTETGFVKVIKMAHVQDGGLILSRLTAESQINGGMIQSLSMALYEGRIMDPRLGVMLNPAFNDYKFAGTMEMPELIPIIDDGDTRNVVIGIAEPANIPGCGAVANAIFNACGVRVRSTPITPDKILNGLIELKRAKV
jgi:xanthine dehydrogenase YagR molybdenum-binding subunit